MGSRVLARGILAWIPAACLALGCSSSSREGATEDRKPPQPSPTQEVDETTVFLAKVRNIDFLEGFAGTVRVVDFDPGWVLSVEVLKVKRGRAFAAGEEVHFAIHSPVKVLHTSQGEAIGKSFWLRYEVAQQPGGALSRSLGPAEDHGGSE